MHPTVLLSHGPLLCSRVWNALTDNYGNVMAVDWKTSHTRSLHLPVLNLADREVTFAYAAAQPRKLAGRRCFINLLIEQKLENQSLDLSDDEELREQMDMHAIIVSSISDEPLFTADQVGQALLRSTSR